MQKAIGVLGGTFNPVHNGHLILAQDALEHFGLSRVLFIPCAGPPHKAPDNLASAEARLAMTARAIEGDERFELSRLEIDRGGTSYAIDTVRALCGLYPESRICFIIGADTLPELHTWKDIGELLDRCEFLTVARPGFAAEDLAARLKLPESRTEQLLKRIVVGHQVDISSSDIRRRVAQGRSIRYLVPRSVEMYIEMSALYRKEHR